MKTDETVFEILSATLTIDEGASVADLLSYILVALERTTLAVEKIADAMTKKDEDVG